MARRLRIAFAAIDRIEFEQSEIVAPVDLADAELRQIQARILCAPGRVDEGLDALCSHHISDLPGHRVRRSDPARVKLVVRRSHRVIVRWAPGESAEAGDWTAITGVKRSRPGSILIEALAFAFDNIDHLLGRMTTQIWKQARVSAFVDQRHRSQGRALLVIAHAQRQIDRFKRVEGSAFRRLVLPLGSAPNLLGLSFAAICATSPGFPSWRPRRSAKVFNNPSRNC
ncbi:hypothetical protein [Terrarubrum flagellatum]|uniref:hypothetical protein n=1 Tax=Terrirubrum flagellatum TaxID=2895980 RepID=UPI003144F52E